LLNDRAMNANESHTPDAAAILAAIDAAADAVSRALGPGAASASPAIVTGSGLGLLATLGRELASIDYAAIPGLGAGTVAGHAGRWALLETAAGPVHCLMGRRHLYEGVEPAAAALAMRVLARLGAKWVLLTNAAGGLTRRLIPGDLMLIDDHLNLMLRNPLIGPHDRRLGPRFPDMSAPYDAALRERLRRAALERGIELKEGVYVALTGPNYETPAEARALRRLGADAVGMSTVPEALAARQAGLAVAAVSLITNSHVMQEETTHEEVLERGREAAGKLRSLIEGVLTTPAAGD
jgi:purine-nucleoside phosphorylase